MSFCFFCVSVSDLVGRLVDCFFLSAVWVDVLISFGLGINNSLIFHACSSLVQCTPSEKKQQPTTKKKHRRPPARNYEHLMPKRELREVVAFSGKQTKKS